MKVCSRCNRELDESNFHKDKTHKDGLRTQCKDCRRELDKKFRDDNPDKCKAWNKSYYENNKDKRKIYLEENADKIKLQKREYDKSYYIEHKDDICTKVAAYRKTDAGKLVKARDAHKRRGYGFNPLNTRFDNSEFHHLHLNNDSDIGIFIPKELHNSIYHNSITGQGMDEINVVALLYLISEHYTEAKLFNQELQEELQNSKL
jgi:hypothetical protein